MSNEGVSNVEKLLELVESNRYFRHDSPVGKLIAIVREWREMLVTDPTIDSETASFYLAKANEIAGGSTTTEVTGEGISEEESNEILDEIYSSSWGSES